MPCPYNCDITTYSQPPAFNNLFQNFGREAGKRVVFHRVADLNRIAADFAILDVGLPANRKIQHYRNFFPTIWAMEEMLHRMDLFRVNLAPDAARASMRFGAVSI
jgi:hypothetical protein